MPQEAADAALRKALIPPYHCWTVEDAVRLCDLNGAKAVKDIVLYKKIGHRLPSLCSLEWDAKAVELPDGRRLILFRDIGNKRRMVWSIVHELGHLKMEHEGAVFDLSTGIVHAAPR